MAGFPKICEHCGKTFHCERSRNRFCSLRCANLHRPVPNIEDRFWTFVDKRADCWLWTGACSGDGYGAFTLRHHVMISAHRFAYQIQIGPIPDGEHVLHRCDIKVCVRGEHLFLGNSRINSDDKVAKLRHSYGSSHGRAKLVEADIIAIRREYAAGDISQTTLARYYGVNQTIISDIVRHVTWRHVPD